MEKKLHAYYKLIMYSIWMNVHLILYIISECIYNLPFNAMPQKIHRSMTGISHIGRHGYAESTRCQNMSGQKFHVCQYIQ